MLELSGQNEELRALAKMFPATRGARLRVWLEDGHCYLHAPEFEGMFEARLVHGRGRQWVTRLNGVGLLKFDRFRPIAVGAVMQPSPYGRHSVTVVAETAVFYLPAPKLVTYIGDPMPALVTQLAGPDAGAAPVPPVEQWIAAADRCTPDVDDAPACSRSLCRLKTRASSISCTRS
jgi:hypothetical protein